MVTHFSKGPVAYLSKKAVVTTQTAKQASLLPEPFRKLHGKRKHSHIHIHTHTHHTENFPSQYFSCLMNLEYTSNFQRKKTQKIFNCSNFSCVSCTWIAGCGSISSLSQSLKALTEFFSSWLVCFCFCLFPFKKSGQ